MVAMRKIGNIIQKLASENHYDNESLASMIDCAPVDIPALYKGIIYPSFEQLGIMATNFKTDIQTLLSGDEEYYESNFVHCMTKFKHPENREKILDFIYSYIDVREAALN